MYILYIYIYIYILASFQKIYVSVNVKLFQEKSY